MVSCSKISGPAQHDGSSCCSQSLLTHHRVYSILSGTFQTPTLSLACLKHTQTHTLLLSVKTNKSNPHKRHSNSRAATADGGLIFLARCLSWVKARTCNTSSLTFDYLLINQIVQHHLNVKKSKILLQHIQLPLTKMGMSWGPEFQRGGCISHSCLASPLSISSQFYWQNVSNYWQHYDR